MKKSLLIIILIAGLFSGPSRAGAIENGVTPYGDSCPKCSNYGVCKKLLTYEESISAISAYFKEMDLEIKMDTEIKLEIKNVRNVKGRGKPVASPNIMRRGKNIRRSNRFIKADIYRGEKLVDVIIFDRKTGRLRSIY